MRNHVYYEIYFKYGIFAKNRKISIKVGNESFDTIN